MTAQIAEQTFSEEWAAWHRGHEAVRADPHGFLAITGLHWLSSEPQRFADAPGSWSAGPDGVTVIVDDNEELIAAGTPVHGEYSFGIIPERGGVTAVSGDAAIEVAKRGGYDIVRPRHPGHPLRASYTGTPAYAPDPRWAIAGRYVPFDEPRDVTVGAAVEGLQHVYASPGVIEFEAGGRPLRLTAFNGKAPGSLMVLFTDATSGVTTYAANRALQIEAPRAGEKIRAGEKTSASEKTRAGGAVTLDFNRAVNLPCAYTDFATCPLPPAENRLPVAVEAGEKIPAERT